MEWCKKDPVVRLGGTLVQIWVAVPAEHQALVDGPVEVEMPDGTLVVCDRPVVALCTCRRSRRQPFCDTSHRTKVRPDA